MSGYKFGMADGSVLSIRGTGNELACSSLSAAGRLGLSFDISSANTALAGLSMTGTLSLSGKGTHIALTSAEDLVDGQKYALISNSGEVSSAYWGEGYITTEGLSGPLAWEEGTLYFTYGKGIDLSTRGRSAAKALPWSTTELPWPEQ